MREPGEEQEEVTEGREKAGPAEEPPTGSPKRGRLEAAAFAAAALAAAAGLRFGTPGVPDPDSFYHLGHAAAYLRHGLFTVDFPWLPFSIIGRFASDIGYGFHLLLTPFAALSDPILGIQLAAVAETLVLMLLVYAVLRQHRVAHAWFWPFALVLLSSPIIWTFVQTRPQTLSPGLAAVLVSSLLRGSAIGTGLASFMVAFVHLNVSPIIAPLIATAAIGKGLAQRRWECRLWLLALVGAGLGYALRPNPLGAARIEHAQILVHEMVRQQNIPLLFGREWSPVPAAALGPFLYFMVVWLGLAAVFAAALVARRERLDAEDRSFLWVTFALSALLFVAMIAVTRRATPFWAVFAVLFIAKAYSCFLRLPASADDRPLLRGDARVTVGVVVPLILLAAAWTGVNDIYIRRAWRGIPPARLKAVGTWLRTNAEPGEVVFNVNWDSFPELFLWDPEHRYVSGLDPIFLYAYDEGLYWKAHHLQTGQAAERTWATMVPDPAKGEDTHAVLQRDFRASYVVLDRRRDSGLAAYMRNDRRYTLVFEDRQSSVFALAAPSPPAAGRR